MNYKSLVTETLAQGGILYWDSLSDYAQLMTKQGRAEFVPRQDMLLLIHLQVVVEKDMRKKREKTKRYVLPKRMAIPTDVGMIEAVQCVRNREWRITYPWGYDHFVGAPWELRVQIVREVKRRIYESHGSDQEGLQAPSPQESRHLHMG